MSAPPVAVRSEKVVLPTYEPLPPDRNPMFLEKRVYQGSSGKVYPLPFYNRIAERPEPREWEAIVIENEFLEIMILPQIGGRVHAARDKTNGYDLFYRQETIKPALVGLAGPWLSGGIEFNWPQHHRPATYMPVATEIERHADGSVTVWCSDHDPLQRLKGMHGVCLHPGRSVLELKVRAHNRTELRHTFLWWANAATRVHEAYQSFFPPDVDYVADHARRSMSAYPLCKGRYYGVDYDGRAKRGVPEAEAPARYLPPASGGASTPDYAANDLSYYANIPVPTSYMCMGSEEDFFGGYDHFRKAGVVHVANHHIAPGKKQWTWGNHEFGYAWDRNLTDPNVGGECAPYIELMAGVFTDNQPDFSFLQPGETRTWSQYWYPIREIGPSCHANEDAALSLHLDNGVVRLGVAVSRVLSDAVVRVRANDRVLFEEKVTLSPAAPLMRKVKAPEKARIDHLKICLADSGGREVIAYAPRIRKRKPVPPPATEPPSPEQIASSDELYMTGLHLEQYLHATRDPELYWREAIRRDAGDSRCHTALGIRRLKRGEFAQAEAHFRSAIERLTRHNANPATGDAHYHLGLTLRHLGRDNEAYAAFYKAVWNKEWQAPGYLALAELDSRKERWETALDHLKQSLRADTDNLRARNLKAVVLRQLGRCEAAEALLMATKALDPLDWFCRYLLGEPLGCDVQTRIDIALDFSRAGRFREALALLADAPAEIGTAPLLFYHTAWLEEKSGNPAAARNARKKAVRANPDYCFPARLEEIAILQSAIAANPKDARAPFFLGNLFYDRRRYREAIALWERAVKLEPSNAVARRNLGIGYFNVLGQPEKAKAAYEKAYRASPSDARLLYERDQLWKRLGESPAKRLREFERRLELVRQRDDLSVEFCALLNQTGAPERAEAVLAGRCFQPWEGGEGQALGQHVRTQLTLGRRALAAGEACDAARHFDAALHPPENLAEARHLLANASDIHFWLGEALSAAGDKYGAAIHWKTAAEFRGDFQEMSVRAFSEMTYYSALAMRRLGRSRDAKSLLAGLLDYARALAKTPAKIDYFATSLPTMLLFDDDLQARQSTTARYLEAQALLGLGRKAAASAKLRAVLDSDPNHPAAQDLLEQLSCRSPWISSP